MTLAIEYSGQIFGSLEVLRRDYSPKGDKAYWYCLCIACGGRCTKSAGSFRTGAALNCGCGRNKKVHPQRFRRYLRGDGYVIIYRPWHPNARKDGRIEEHRMIMTHVLGRPLLNTETVHHKNGIRHDNRPDNLELWSGSHIGGQRVEDLIDFAIKTLKIYKPEVLLNDKR